MVQAITDDPERLPVNEVRRRWWALGVIALAQMLVVIDTTIVTIALPSVQRSIGLSADSRQWVITAYTLAFGGALLLGGRLGDRFAASGCSSSESSASHSHPPPGGPQ
jgi:MFS family permease